MAETKVIRYRLLPVTVRKRHDATRPGEAYVEQAFQTVACALLGVHNVPDDPPGIEAILRVGVNTYPRHLQAGFLEPLPLAALHDVTDQGAGITVRAGQVIALQLHNLTDDDVKLQLEAELLVVDDGTHFAPIDGEGGFELP